jgi:hypothetical protein
LQKKTQISNLMKMHPVGAELLHTDRHTNRQDMTKLIVAYHNFTKAPTNYYNFIPTVQFSVNASLEI